MDTMMPSLDFTPLGIAVKLRNAVFDSVFYDVTSLDPFDELIRLNPLADRKGKIIVVSPSGSARKDTIRHYSSPAEFYNSPDWESVFALVVTGVGSSVVGTAALARNVADACQKQLGDSQARNVAGVVSGFGLSDVTREGLGGYFFYGMLNQYRFAFNGCLDLISAVISDNFKAAMTRKKVGDYFGSPLGDYVPIGADVVALVKILSALYLKGTRPSNLRLLVGHSKGNLLIADAINNLSDELRHVEHPALGLMVVTLGAVVDIATDIIWKENQKQFLGSLDGLGRLNSRTTQEGLAPHECVSGKWHSLNRKLPLHMDVFEDIFEKVVIPPPPGKTRGAEPMIELQGPMNL
jgi:hypothetical protein